jgi:outer membrane receptor protein involved in Fe transport
MHRYRTPNHQRLNRLPLAVAICFAIAAPAFAQDAATEADKTEQAKPADRTANIGTVTVTAQKREENLQEVPISIQVLGTQQLEQQNVNDFEDYVKLLPSVSITPIGPGFGQVYMRGVASGGDGNHSGSLPSVGMYLDEQPITTIQGNLDVHVYDMARIESLAGPQGTLYGASSQAGTIRLITNKPDPSGFVGGAGVEMNVVDGGGVGHVAEGFVNLPLSENAAVRLVGWKKHDAGYIDNVLGTRTYPTWDNYTGGNGTVDNASQARDDYNEVDTVGARGALLVNLNDSWTVTGGFMAQKQEAEGGFAFDPVVGDNQLTHFYPETSDDRWWQAAFTVQGKIGDFDLVYAFSHLKRDVDTQADYNDYGFWYDTLYAYGYYFYDDNYDIINPSQYIQGKDRYKKTSHELRISSPQDWRFRFVAGVFWQNQFHDIEQRYKIDGLADWLSVRGWDDTIWLTKQERRDRDRAFFGEMSYDFTDKLTGTAGFRRFKAHNSLAGFFGFAYGYASQSSQPPSNRYGEAACTYLYGSEPSNWEPFNGAPCEVFDKEVKETGTLGRLNLTYKFNDRAMIYGTWSEGYRPGGINRRGILPPYLSDYLTNYEFGWKTSWMDNRLQFNGAIFQEDWKDFQFSILGLNGLTEIKNAAQAQIQGVEMDVAWAATYNLMITGGLAYYDAKLTANYCGFLDSNGNPETDCADPEAPKGTRLPVTAEFKGNLNARYTFEIGGREAYWQATYVYEGRRRSDLRTFTNDVLGEMPAYGLFDLAAGIKGDDWALDFFVKNVFDERAQFSRFVACSDAICGNAVGGSYYPVPPEYANGQVYIVPGQPRTFGVRYSREFQ